MSQLITVRLTNEKLYGLCKKYGTQARFWRQKFIGLLPEVNKRRLYAEKGFASIFEFAAKLCGLSAEQVRLTLNLEKRFENQPILKKMLENGETSINKLTRIVSIVTPDNEEELAAKIKLLPISALNTMVRDVKGMAVAEKTGHGNGSLKPQNGIKNLYVQTDALQGGNVTETLKFQIADDVTAELNELNSKGIDVNELLREMLKRRREEIVAEKEEIAEEINTAKSRYIPVRIKRILAKEHGGKCSLSDCRKQAEAIHHTQRFSLSKNHDPRFLAPLCHDHHVIAHSLDVKFQKTRVAADIWP